jgi:hypothetical protein
MLYRMTNEQNLRENPYMTVEIVERDNIKGRTKIRVWYPDVLHYNPSLVSVKTHQMVSSISAETYRSDSKVFAKMNALLMEDMIEQWLIKIYDQYHTYYSTLSEVVRWISPCSDEAPVR